MMDMMKERVAEFLSVKVLRWAQWVEKHVTVATVILLLLDIIIVLVVGMIFAQEKEIIGSNVLISLAITFVFFTVNAVFFFWRIDKHCAERSKKRILEWCALSPEEKENKIRRWNRFVNRMTWVCFILMIVALGLLFMNKGGVK